MNMGFDVFSVLMTWHDSFEACELVLSLKRPATFHKYIGRTKQVLTAESTHDTRLKKVGQYSLPAHTELGTEFESVWQQCPTISQAILAVKNKMGWDWGWRSTLVDYPTQLIVNMYTYKSLSRANCWVNLRLHVVAELIVYRLLTVLLSNQCFLSQAGLLRSKLDSAIVIAKHWEKRKN